MKTRNLCMLLLLSLFSNLSAITKDSVNVVLEELDAAIPVLKESGFASVFADVDYIYGGDMTKWVKFANTLKLRLALRLVNVNPTLAQQKAEEAANDAVGLISEPADAAWSSFIPGGNSLHKINISWNEGAVSADILSYMNGSIT